METKTGRNIMIAAAIAYLLFNSIEDGHSSNNPPIMETFFFPPVDNPQIRNDDWGGGHFGDSRKRNGQKYSHRGVDLIVFEGQNIFCPMDCYVTRNTTVYQETDKWKGIVLRGINEYEGLEIKIFYMTSVVQKNDFVPKGQMIGFAQAISQNFDSKMLDHIHLELRDNNRLVDPADYLFTTT